jgi:hypothetical protein
MSSSNKMVFLDPAVFRRFFNVLVRFSTASASFLHCTPSTFWWMRYRAATTCARYSLVFPQEKMDMFKMVPLGSLIFRVSGTSLVVTKSIGGTYETSGRLLSCPFLHSESISPSGVLRVVLILACCQSVVLSMSLLKEDLGGTHRNQAACVVA